MKFKNLFVIAVLGFAIIAEPLPTLARPFSSRSSSSSSSRSSSGFSSGSSSRSSSRSSSSGWSSGSRSSGSSSKNSSSGWGSSSKSSDSSSKSYSSGSSGWGSSSKNSSSSFNNSSSDNKSKSSGWASSDSSTKKNISSDSASSDSSNKKSTGWGTSSSGSTWGTSQKLTDSSGSTSYKTPSKGDVALERKAIQSGTAYKNKDAAMSDFKTKYADKYPSKFTTEPTVRPDYIPRTYSTGGNTYNVVYNAGFGGYGYYNALGAWIAYDVMTDAIMMGSLMHRHSYYYPSHSTTYVDGGTTVVHTTNSGIGFFWGFMWFLVVIFTIFLIVWFIAKTTD